MEKLKDQLSQLLKENKELNFDLNEQRNDNIGLEKQLMDFKQKYNEIVGTIASKNKEI